MSQKNSFSPVIGVGVLIWREKNILLGKRLAKDGSQDCWQFPGGHLQAGESVAACARREVSEETGLKVNALRHLGFTDKAFTVDKRQYITLFVSSEYVSGEAQLLEPDKCACWQWFDYQQLPAPLFQPISLFMSQQDDLYALHHKTQVMSDIPSDVHR